MKKACALLLLAVFQMAPAAAANLAIIDKLDQEEATWHKGMLFSTAMTAKDADEYRAVLDWLKLRVNPQNMPDSRYALTYSLMLGGTRDPKVSDTANAFAIVGYAALQIDSARCENRPEALALARQWYGTVQARLKALNELPADKRQQYWQYADFYLNVYASRKETPLVKNPTWICKNLPSYLAKIQPLPDVVVEAIPTSKGNASVYYRHASIAPDYAAPDAFADRVKSILKDMQSLVLEAQ